MIYLEPEEEAEEILMDDEDIKVEAEVVEIEGSDPISCPSAQGQDEGAKRYR